VRDWKIRVVPNLFAAMIPQPLPPTPEWVAIPGHGYHEVIIDSPDHGAGASGFDEEQMDLLLTVFRDRYSYYRSMDGIRYVSLFKNRGLAAGASLHHSHSQVVAIPILPPMIKREISAISSASFCLYCNVVNREEASDRFIAGNDSWILIAPFFSQAPYETWILSREHVSNIEDLTDKQMSDLGQILRTSLSAMAELLDDPPYNFMFYQLEYDYHFNLRIQPAISKIAGFEKSTGVYINPVPPEQAASELRGALHASKNRKVDELTDGKVII
jgi:UDPglucose--hexose-1-phosphate uridylyltransferase